MKLNEYERLMSEAADRLVVAQDTNTALRKALQDIAGDDEPRAALAGTTAEELRNIARRALVVTSQDRGTQNV